MTTTVNEGDKVNLTIPKGPTFKRIFYYKTKAGVAVPLTGYTGKCQFRTSASDTTVLYDSTTTGDITIDAPTGTVTLEIPAATTAAWTFSSAVYDVMLFDAVGKETLLVQGRVTVKPTVTR